MSNMTLKNLSEQMADIDITMLSTLTENGEVSSRPMSNNGDVEYNGDSYYFTWEKSRMVADIERNPKVGLSFQGSKRLLGGGPFLIAVEGKGENVRDRARFEDHWNKDLEMWFPDGIDTPGIVMIKVRATRIHYWNGEEEGEVSV
jgi:general stress protein 26